MQAAANTLRQSSSTRVYWIDTAGPVPMSRLNEFVSQNPSQYATFKTSREGVPADVLEAGTSERLSRFHHRHISTLPHLLTLLSFPYAMLHPSSTTLLVLDNISSLMSISFPYSRSSSAPRTATKNALSFASSRRFSISGDISAALSKLAALKNVAVLVINQTGTNVRGGGKKAVLKPSLGGKEWDAHIGTRLAIYRDFAYEDYNFRTTPTRDSGRRSCRWIEVVKGGRRYEAVIENDPGETKRKRVAFEIGAVRPLHTMTKRLCLDI